METTNQVVLQITTADQERLIVQYGTTGQQVIVNYNDLSSQDKTTVDNFLTLANSQIPV